MDIRRTILAVIISAISLVGAVNAPAQQRNDKILNRPYSDLRRWHMGFSVGINTLDLAFTHNGFVTADGQSWFMEQPSFSPGFCVNGLFNLRLNDYFSVRLSPAGMMGVLDLSKKRNRDLLQLKSTDFMLSVGFGCDLYLPFFKLCPELKFCFGLTDVIKHKRPDLEDDPDRFKYTQSLTKATQQMVVLTFYFE